MKKPVDFTESKPETSIWDSPVSQKSLLMNYSKEKTEAAKILLAQIIEVNERLEKAGSEKEIQFELNGGKFPELIVRFWDWEGANNPQETFEISLERYLIKDGRRHNLLDLAEKVKDWGERFGNSERKGY